MKSPSTLTPSKTPGSRKRRRWPLPIFLLLIAAFAGANALYIKFGEDPDIRAIRFERAQRLATASVGMALPGTPDLANLTGRLSDHGVRLGAPIFVRIFKREFELELWMQRDGRFHRFATYPICRWSGQLGPKLKQGDHQAPEGFYTVDAKALNPNSRWHRSFNLGFPNVFDQAHDRTGSFLMVHGGCASIGCYAMTNPVIDELWKLVTAALDGGQKRFQVQVLPFRMTAANLEHFNDNTHAEFWHDLKAGYDLFDAGNLPPRISVCGKRYVAEAAGSVIDGSAPIEVNCDAKALNKA